MKNKKFIFVIIIILILLINTFTLSYAEQSTDSDNSSSLPSNSATDSQQSTENRNTFDVPEPDFTIYSDGAILIDATTGKVLAGKDFDKILYPASTTKILTAILAIENCSLDEQITASRSAVMSIPVGYSNAGIVEGETISVSDLLDMFLIHSANEIGFIFAEHISGSVSDFADLMNKKAVELGCTNTHFTNPSGIQDEDHYTTAHDLALIAKYCMQNETFRNIVSKTSCRVAPTNKYDQERYFKNTNSLLDSSNRYYYENAIGVKTGFTTQAKNCLIAASQKDGFELIAVILGAEATEEGLSGRYVDAINLLNYGNDNYQVSQFATANNVVQDIVVPNATKETENLQLIIKDSLSGLVSKTLDLQNLKYSVEINDNISAPITSGTVLGKITYNIDGILYSSDLIASHDVEESKILTIIFQIILAILVLIIFAKLLSWIKNYNNKKFKKIHKNKHKKSKKYDDNSNSIYKFNI